MCWHTRHVAAVGDTGACVGTRDLLLLSPGQDTGCVALEAWAHADALCQAQLPVGSAEQDNQASFVLVCVADSQTH